MKTSLQIVFEFRVKCDFEMLFLKLFFKLKVIVHPKNENCHPLLTLK